MDPYWFNATFEGNYDGDSIALYVDLGFNRTLEYPKPPKFRLNGIDTPEVSRGSELHRAAGKAVRDWLREFIGDSSVLVRTHKPDPKEKYGRYLADIYMTDGRNVNKLLIGLGFEAQLDAHVVGRRHRAPAGVARQ